MVFRRFIILLATGLALPCTYAAEPETPPMSEEAFIGDLPVVLSVTRLAQPKSETPAAVTVIDSDMIRASGVRNIPDLLWLVPGFQIGYPHAPHASVTYHGFSDAYARRMQVLIDGRSVYGPLTGGVFWLDLALAIDDIERIEVTRGPNSASYGSNSFLGVINIITRHASQDRGVFAKLAAGEHAVRDGVVRYGWAGIRGHSRLTASHQQSDGFDGLPDHVRTSLVTFRGDYQLDAGNTIELQFGANAKNHGTGRFGNPVDNPRESQNDGRFQSLRWRHTLAAENEVSIQLFHNYWERTDDYLTDPLNLGLLGTIQIPLSGSGQEDRYDFELQHAVRLSPKWRLVWGGGARLDRARAPFYFGADPVENRTRSLFGNAEWRISPSSVLNLGAFQEKHSLFGSELSPRIALNHHLSPQHTIRVAVSQANRIPSLGEERTNASARYQGIELDRLLVSPGGLKAETLRSTEVGYLGQIPQANLALDVRLFRDRLRNLLTGATLPVADLDGKVLTVRNEGSMEISGAETQIVYRHTPATRLILNYAHMRADASGLGADASFDEAHHERSVPAYTWSALAMYRFGRWEGSAGYRRVASLEWLNIDTAVGSFVKSYGRLDLRLARDYRAGEYRGQVAVTLQNLGPDTTTFAQNVDVFDRRAFVTLTLKR